MNTEQPIQVVVNRSEHLRDVRQFEEAEALCRRTLVQEIGHGGMLFQSAAIAFSTFEPKVALRRFKRVETVYPGASAVHFNIGICNRGLQHHEQACGSFQKALILDPTAEGAMNSLAQSRTTLGDLADARGLATRAIALRPSSAKAFLTLGLVAWKAGDREIADKAFRSSILLDPGAREADVNIGNLLAESGFYGQAIRRYHRLLRLVPDDQDLWGNLGVASIAIGDWHGASKAYARFVRLKRGRPLNDPDADEGGDGQYPRSPRARISPVSRQTAWHRLKYDFEQLKHLLDRNLIPNDFVTELEAYEEIIANLDPHRRSAISFDLTTREMEKISRYHERFVHHTPTGWRLNKPESSVPRVSALNRETDWHRASKNFTTANPAVTVIDNFLDPVALSALRKFCLESTIWFELKGAGYLGAYFREGFNDPLLIAIAEEMTDAMPEVFSGHPLRMIWAYTYEQSMVGINPHADFAKINVNFWITPDSANLDEETGGLLIYRRPAPATWGFEQYNAAPGHEVMEFLGEDAENPIRVPHRQNRAVIFDSRLFHETDRLTFREGLENRRINITMLFGDQ
jgi:tetratricopeptide (TPR) repeat protein